MQATVAPVGTQGTLVSQWTADDVSVWLKGMQLEGAASKFQGKNVTGHDLEVLTIDEIQQLGLTKIEASAVKTELSRLTNAHYTVSDDEDDHEVVLGREQSVDVSAALPMIAPGQGGFKPAMASSVPSNSTLPLDSATLQRYIQSLDTIKQIESTGDELKLPSEEAKLKSTEDLVRCKAVEFDELHKSLKYYQAKKTASGVGSKIGSLMGGGHSANTKAELKAQIEAQIDDIQRKESAVSAALTQLRAEKDQQNAVVVQLRAQVARLQEARQFESDVTRSVFAGAAGDAKENELERAVDAELPKLEQLRSTKATFYEVQEMIKSALQKLETAEHNYKNAAHLDKVDWLIHKVTGRKGGVVTDVAKQSNIIHATSLAESAVIELAEAKKKIPDLPKLDVARLEAFKSGGFKHPYQDTSLTQKENEKLLKANLKEVKKFDSHCESAMGWIEKWLAKRIDPDLQRTEVLYNTKKTQLDLYRRELMQAEIKARGLT